MHRSNTHMPGRQEAGRPVASRAAVLAILATVRGEPETLGRMAPTALRNWMRTLDFALRRERNKSTMRHWSYDLNRHIALKRARDAIADELAARAGHRNAKAAARAAAS